MIAKKPSIEIDGRVIGAGNKPYVIAEISANHNGKLEAALQLIEAAARSGADAVKLQTYTPDTITLDSDAEDFLIKAGPWAGRTLYDLYTEAHTPWEWHEQLFRHAREHGITIFSSPFDYTAVDFLEELGAPAYKIASFEAVDIPLIEYVARCGKPMIISTGMASFDEVREAVDAALGQGCGDLAILHCVSGYPAPASDYNLHTIPDMMEQFDLVTGLSDHTLGNATAIASVALGASIVEKHMTLDRGDGGPDAAFSLEPDELVALCGDLGTAWKALGEVDYGRKSSEVGNVQFRRSLYYVRDLEAGERISADAVRSVRPGFGLAPKHLDSVLGARVKTPVKANSAVTWEDVEASK